MAKSAWEPISLQPLTGPLDTRTRPADLMPGAYRWKLNMAVNRSGRLCLGTGFDILDFGQRSDFETNPVNNWDHHRRGGARKPLTFIWETVASDRTRYLFDGDENSVFVMDNATSEWTTLITGMGEELARWKADLLADQAIFTNDVDKPQIHNLGSGTTAEIPDLNSLEVTKAKIVVQYGGVIILMNIEQAGERHANRIRWSDYRDAESWSPGGASVASFQDLDDGEEILACGELAGVLYVFTTKAIWKMFIQVTNDSIFGFNRWYSDPKTRTATIAYENTLVATGKEFFYLGQNTIYWFNQFSPAPTSPDWLLNASGTMFEHPTDRIDPLFCKAPVAWYDLDNASNARAIWFSYPRSSAATAGINDYCLVLNQNTDSVQTQYQTAYYSDYGFTAFVTANRGVEGEVICRASSLFIGAGFEDWSLKHIGEVFKRVVIQPIDNIPENDIPDGAMNILERGYFRIIRGLAPLGYPQDDKLVDNVMLDHDVKDTTTNLLRLRMGNSYHLADPNDLGPSCGVQWAHVPDADGNDLPLACPDGATLAQMETEKQRPDSGTEWQPYTEGRYIYFEITVTDALGNAPTGGDSAWTSIVFNVLRDP